MPHTPPLPPDDDDGPALAPDIVDLLNTSATDAVQDAAATARVKHRLLKRIATEQHGQHLTVRAQDGEWQPFGPGLTIKVLHQHGGLMSYLVRLAPGARLAAHRHPVDEECVVLEGTLRIGELEVGAGGFHLGRQDRLHMPIVSEGGALIYLHGAVPDLHLLV